MATTGWLSFSSTPDIIVSSGTHAAVTGAPSYTYRTIYSQSAGGLVAGADGLTGSTPSYDAVIYFDPAGLYGSDYIGLKTADLSVPAGKLITNIDFRFVDSGTTGVSAGQQVLSSVYIGDSTNVGSTGNRWSSLMTGPSVGNNGSGTSQTWPMSTTSNNWGLKTPTTNLLRSSTTRIWVLFGAADSTKVSNYFQLNEAQVNIEYSDLPPGYGGSMALLGVGR